MKTFDFDMQLKTDAGEMVDMNVTVLIEMEGFSFGHSILSYSPILNGQAYDPSEEEGEAWAFDINCRAEAEAEKMIDSLKTYIREAI